MDPTTPTPPPPLADEALGAVMQLAQAASRHEDGLGADARSGDASRHASKVRGRDMADGGRANKQVRLDAEHGAGVDAQALSWASAPPPAYGTPHDPHASGNGHPSPYGSHALDQNTMSSLPHGDAAFDPSAHGVPANYSDGSVGVSGDDGSGRSAMGSAHAHHKHATSESTGLVGARGKTGMTRALSTSRRAEQNRNAQRVFRERKNKYITDLETKAASLENALLAAEEHRRRFNDALETIEILKRDNDTLRVALRALGGHQAVPSAPALPMDRAAHSSALLQPSFGPQHGPGSLGRAPHQGGLHDGSEHTDATHGGVQNAGGAPGLHEAPDGQDPATVAAVAAAASGGAPYWLLEAVSNANQQHGFPVSGHFPAHLGDNGMGQAPQGHGPMHPADANAAALRARGAQGGSAQRADGMIDPSLDHGRLGAMDADAESRQSSRAHGDDTVKHGGAQHMDSSGNPDNLASLSAVAAAAAAASSQKPAASQGVGGH
ncbi:hypothetical protein MSPP1_002056 [Malassezia sp. CBS 17886]|nr:hypothetical protein MSPP1_002056 [Malassezia sp. CBS 17886]